MMSAAPCRAARLVRFSDRPRKAHRHDPIATVGWPRQWPPQSTHKAAAMSIHVMSMVYRARLGSITRKAIALKLASCAEDDGTRIYPSTATIASEVECGVRVVQYTLREFEQEKLLIVVTRGDRGPRSTTHYRMNLARLAALTPADDASSKGAPDAPSKKDAVGAPIAARKGAPDAKKGAPGAPDSSEIRQKEDPLYSPSVPLGDAA